MLWKEDSEQAKQRMDAWRHQEVIDRPCILVGVWPHEIGTLMAKLRPEGLMFTCHCSSELEAKALVEQAAKWARPRGSAGKEAR